MHAWTHVGIPSTRGADTRDHQCGNFRQMLGQVGRRRDDRNLLGLMDRVVEMEIGRRKRQWQVRVPGLLVEPGHSSPLGRVGHHDEVGIQPIGANGRLHRHPQAVLDQVARDLAIWVESFPDTTSSTQNLVDSRLEQCLRPVDGREVGVPSR
jgi:hypothetical protein